MLSTRVGYAAGTTPEPSYYKMGDHAECTEVVFDPEVITYSQILDKFWEWHNPYRKAWSRQYMSAILYHDEVQHEAIKASVKALGREVHTEIAPYKGMTLGEDYHQKYYLRRNRKLVHEFARLFPDEGEFLNSTQVARANAALGGYLRLSAEEVAGYGLSQECQDLLLKKKSSGLLGMLGL